MKILCRAWELKRILAIMLFNLLPKSCSWKILPLLSPDFDGIDGLHTVGAQQCALQGKQSANADNEQYLVCGNFGPLNLASGNFDGFVVGNNPLVKWKIVESAAKGSGMFLHCAETGTSRKIL